jgi:hypothetical protein
MSGDDQKTRVLQRRPAADAAAVMDGKIVFHCPNGDRVVVPAALAGKRGKCSKCGIEVTIPTPGGLPPAPEQVATVPLADAAAASPDVPLEPAPAAAMEAVAVTEPNAATEPAAGDAEVAEGWNFIGDQAEQPSAWHGGDAAAGFLVDGSNPTATLVARLWAERQHGGVIELHLAGGSVILPEWYDANWSRGTHGLFASQAADGSVTLTAVAWETVQKVVVRQLTEVPDDMFA